MKTKENREYVDDIYSNFDRSYDHDEQYVKDHPDGFFNHSAWNFCGYIWFDNTTKKFYEEVWCYRSHMKTLEGDSLEEVIDETNSNYGYD